MVMQKGGAREGAGRKAKLLFEQMHWLKQRYKELMDERAKERAVHQNLMRANKKEIGEELENDGEDLYSSLKNNQDYLRSLPLIERKSEDVKPYQEYSGAIIGRRRYVKVGSGRGPLLKTGYKEKTAEDIRQQVANEANKKWIRRYITSRTVRTACAMDFSDKAIFFNWLNKTS